MMNLGKETLQTGKEEKMKADTYCNAIWAWGQSVRNLDQSEDHFRGFLDGLDVMLDYDRDLSPEDRRSLSNIIANEYHQSYKRQFSKELSK